MRNITRYPNRALTLVVASAAMLGMAATLTACGSSTQAGAGSSQSQSSGDQDVQKELKKLNTLMDKAFVLKSDTSEDQVSNPATIKDLDTYYKSIDPNKLTTVKQVKQTEAKLTAAMKKVQDSVKK